MSLVLFKKSRLQGLLDAKINSLREGINWFPFPAGIGYLLGVVLVANIFIPINPRTGNLAETIEIDSGHDITNSAIWISVLESEGTLMVRTQKGDVLRIEAGPNGYNRTPLIDYLTKRAEEMAIDAGLAKDKFAAQFSVLISADQALKYQSIVPILQAIAAAGISEYAFETQIPARME